MNVFVRPVAAPDSVPVQATFETERSIHGYAWANASRIIYVRDDGGDENFHIYACNPDGSNTVPLTPFDGVRAGIVDMLHEVPDDILVSMNKRDRRFFDVFRMNIITGEHELVAENPGNILGWITDHEGKVRAALAGDGVNRSLLYRNSEHEPFTAIATTNFRDTLVPLQFTFDNKQLYVSSNRGRNTQGVYLFDPATGLETECIYANDEYDTEAISLSRKRKVLLEVRYTSWKNERVIFDDDQRRLYAKVSAQLPAGCEISFIDYDDNEENYIVGMYSDVHSGTYYHYNTLTDSLTLLAQVRPELNPDDLAPMKPVSYTSRDGLTIHGYLTLPKNAAPANLPVIVFPHGGPWVRDDWGFDGRVQFLVNRGYGVLQMNYRGSTGYGRAFWEASFRQWGRTMQDDITDAVTWLIDQGIADARRVAILGGSYGGYAVLAGLTFTPDVYACGIDIVGVSNLFTFRKTIPEYWKPLNDMTNEMIGDPVADEELLRAVSPVFHVHRITAPLLVFQGAKDPRVNIEESNQIVSALRGRGIDVEYIVKEDEGHGFHNEENKVEMYGIIERFLKKHLG